MPAVNAHIDVEDNRLAIVQRMLGHASAAMTQNVYSDLFDDDLNAVADALDQARSKVNVSTKVQPLAEQTEKAPRSQCFHRDAGLLFWR